MLSPQCSEQQFAAYRTFVKEIKLIVQQNEVDFIESHILILHYLKIVHLSSTELR